MESENYNYLLAYVNSDNKFPIPISQGICVPKVCKSADLNEIKPYLIPGINTLMPFILDSTKGFNLNNTTLSSADILFDDSFELNEKYTDVTLLNGLFITMMVFYVIATVTATFIAHKRYK